MADKAVVVKHVHKYQMDTNTLQRGLSRMWHNTCLFDLKIIAGEREFHAHKIVLAASSPYFEAMFTHGFKEADLIDSKDGIPTINLHSVSSAALEVILNSIYTGELEIQNSLLSDLVDLASYLQYEEILCHCEAHMKKYVRRQNLFDYLELAHKYNLSSAANVIIQKLLDTFGNCLDVSDTFNNADVCRFLELPVDIVEYCLKNDSLAHCDERDFSRNELSIFHLACKWLQHRDDRLVHTEKLLQCIRYAHMNSEHLSEVSSHPIVLGNDKCLKRVLTAEDYGKDELAKPLFPPDLHTPRGDLEFVILPMDDEDELTFSSYNNRALCSSSFVTPVRRRVMSLSVKAVNVGHYAYILGVVSEIGLYENVFFRCHDTWEDNDCLTLNPLEGSGRLWGVMAYCDEHIYLAGGILMQDWMLSGDNNFHNHVTTACAKYSIRVNSWEQIASLPYPSLNGQMTSANGIVYYAGPVMYQAESRTGTADDMQDGSMECLIAYDKAQDEWSFKEPMISRREKFSLNGVGNSLYVIGGYRKISEEDVTFVPSEVYDTETDQWTELEASDISRYLWNTSFVHKTDIYIFAQGVDQDNPNDNDIVEQTTRYKDIHVFHTQTHKWSSLNQDEEFMWDLPHVMCYRICPGTTKGHTNFPPPRVNVL